LLLHSGLKTEITAGGISRADHATPPMRKKLSLTSLTSGGRSVGIVRSRTKATELLFIIIIWDLAMLFFGGG
jgi:hypothetical protein